MAYFRQEETRTQIENWYRWGDDRPAHGGCAIAWDELTAAKREQRSSDGLPSPLGRDASITDQVLKQMDQQEATALKWVYTKSSPIRDLAQWMHMSRRTFHTRLERGHVHFWAIRTDLVTAPSRFETRAGA